MSKSIIEKYRISYSTSSKVLVLFGQDFYLEQTIVNLFLRIIRRAGHTSAAGLNMLGRTVHQHDYLEGTLDIYQCMNTWILHIHGDNEVSIVLPCPGGWAAGLSWDHQDCLTD